MKEGHVITHVITQDDGRVLHPARKGHVISFSGVAELAHEKGTRPFRLDSSFLARLILFDSTPPAGSGGSELWEFPSPPRFELRLLLEDHGPLFARTEGGEMMKSFLLPAATLWWREVIRFLRQRSRVGAALGTPLLFWLFLGSGIGSSFQSEAAPAGMNYLEYFYPGTLILVILFTSIFSSISLIEDRKEGFLLSVLVAPVSRSGPVFGKILGGATLAFLQGAIFVLFAPLTGIPLTLAKVPLLAAAVFLNAFALTSLGFAFAWQIDSTQGFHGVMNMVLFPMWLLSGALFPAAGASTWVQWTMFFNPLAYGLAALQAAFYGQGAELTGGTTSALNAFIVIAAFGLAAFVGAFQLAQRRTAKGVA